MIDNLVVEPYETIRDFSQGNIIWEQADEHKNERKLYRQLIAIYQSVREHPEGLIAESIVLQANQILEELSQGQNNYTSHIYPKNRLQEFPLYFTGQLKTNLLTALETIAEDYNFEEPSSILGRYMQTNTTTINNHNNNTANAKSDQKQNQEQSTSVNLLQIEQIIEDTLSAEQLKEIQSELEAYKAAPKKWLTVQSLINKLLTFGSAVAPIIKMVLAFFLSA